MKLFSDLHSSSATVLGFPVYGDNTPKIIDYLHTILTNLSDIKYALLYRLHPKHQHHIVRTGLPPAYHCEDTLILHSCMTLLAKYVDNFKYHDDQTPQRPGEPVLEEFNKELATEPDPNAPEQAITRQLNAQTEALAIYRWWKYERPKDIAEQNKLTHELYADPNKDSADREFKRDKLWALNDKIFNDEQEYLIRLIKIRPSLWH